MSRPRKKVLLKIIILGDSNVGKTALLHKYVHGAFIQEHKATIGADFLTKEISIDDKLVTLQVWDTAGQERFQSLGTAFYRGADACVLMYDITNDQSFKQIETWYSNFLEQASPEDTENFPFLLCGNKSDLKNARVVQTQDGERLAKQYKMIFYETSALDGTNVETAVRKIASVASELDTVPCFQEDIGDKGNLDLEEAETKTEAAGCSC